MFAKSVCCCQFSRIGVDYMADSVYPDYRKINLRTCSTKDQSQIERLSAVIYSMHKTTFAKEQQVDIDL